MHIDNIANWRGLSQNLHFENLHHFLHWCLPLHLHYHHYKSNISYQHKSLVCKCKWQGNILNRLRNINNAKPNIILRIIYKKIQPWIKLFMSNNSVGNIKIGKWVTTVSIPNQQYMIFVKRMDALFHVA